MRVPARFETVEQDSIVWRVLYVRPDGMWHDTGWSDYQAGPIQRTLLDTRLVIPRLLEVLAEVASTQGASAPSTSHPDEVVERFEDLLVACLNRPPSDWGPMRKLSPDEQADADAEARIEKTALLASVSSALAALRSRPEHRGGWVQTRGGSSGIWSLLPLHSERPRRALFSSFREPLPASFAGWELRRSALNQPDLSIAIGASQHACSGMFDGTIDQLIDVAQLDFTPRGESYYQGRIDRGSMDVIRLLMQILQVAQEVLATR